MSAEVTLRIVHQFRGRPGLRIISTTRTAVVWSAEGQQHTVGSRTSHVVQHRVNAVAAVFAVIAAAVIWAAWVTVPLERVSDRVKWSVYAAFVAVVLGLLFGFLPRATWYQLGDTFTEFTDFDQAKARLELEHFMRAQKSASTTIRH